MSRQALIDAYMDMGISPKDTDEEKIKKRMLSFLPLIIGIVATAWGSVYILLGHYLSASIPLFYAVVSALNLVHFAYTKQIIFLQISQLLLVLFLPFFLMWSLGGFAGGSFMLIWAFFAPVAAMAFEKNKNSKWFVAFIILIFVSAFLNATLTRTAFHLPEIWINIFFVLNSVVGFGGIYAMFLYYIKDKEKRSEAVLLIEHEKLLKKSAELEHVNAKLENLAIHDTLTGLHNRYALLERLQNSINFAQKNNQKLALFFIDLDRFKQINDSLGHAVGDEVLIHVGKLLLGSIHGNDLVARLGGDEFVVLIDQIQDAYHLSSIADKIIKVVQQVIELENQELQVTCSIGISIYPDDIEESESLESHTALANLLLRNADAAMYRAKDEGKNNYQFYQPSMTSEAFEQMTLEKNLRNALLEDELVVYYQPQIDIVTETIIGMEALVRWNHPKLGMIPPMKFIPMAEDIGLIVLLDRIVMDKAMKQLSQWYKDGFNPGILSLNLSVKQLQQSDFIEKISTLIEEHGCLASWIEFEITEGQIMRNPDKSITVLEAIDAMGIKLSVDDFGTGYSSLSYLKRLPIKKLKIDQSFVRDIPDDKDDMAIVNTIINLADNLGLNIIAEGVETEEQKDFLLAHGCRHVQGYFYAKPMKAEEMTVMLNGPMGKQHLEESSEFQI